MAFAFKRTFSKLGSNQRCSELAIKASAPWHSEQAQHFPHRQSQCGRVQHPADLEMKVNRGQPQAYWQGNLDLTPSHPIHALT